MNPHSNEFIDLIKHPVKFRMFLFSKLPSAFFSGLRIKTVDQKSAVVCVPYKWFSKNPFHSTYFACLAMAAEMSTGLLALLHIYKRKPEVSMLVIKMEANYFKKAIGLTSFSCLDGMAIENAIEAAVISGDGQQEIAKSVGTNDAGERIAEFFITWSFKAKKKG